MSKMKYATALTLVLIIAVIVLVNPSVLAEWIYGEALSANIDLEVNVIVMPWEGADELPSQTEYGNNHKVMIDNVLNGTYVSGNTTQNIGLNTEDSYLVQEIAKRQDITYRDADELGSMDIWQSDRINELFNLSSSSNKVEFILHFPDEPGDTYYLYSTNLDLGDGWTPEIPIGTYIYQVYKTTLQKNSEGVWEAISTEVGKAKSARYSNPYTGLGLGNAFDISTWEKGKMGTGLSDAIYTKLNYAMPVECLNETDETYYYYDSTATNNRTVSIQNSDKAIAYVYDSDGNLVQTRNNSTQGSQTVIFKPRANTRYYIKITGDVYCTFTIS
ncbi:MAG: hypothetical protein IKC00_01000 [Clostridia bacterium]|nr:hypothetical protein [Clostridia bacterium]